LLKNCAGILAYMSDEIKAIHGDVEAADFLQHHSCVIAPLALVSNGTRRVTGSGADCHRRAAERGRNNGVQGGVRGLWGGVEGELRPKGPPQSAHSSPHCALVYRN